MEAEKQSVQDFWNKASCGEELYLVGADDKEKFMNQMEERYRLEPFILDFANFNGFKGKNILEIGVGLGSDHQKYGEGGALLHGIDLTQRAINFTKERIKLFGLQSNLAQGDAESLKFENEKFDLVYSWGVIHHSPDTQQCVNEIYRVLKPGGEFKVMIYHKYSIVGYLLWVRYALLTFRPFTSLDAIYSKYLESPGTKAYSRSQALELFKKFANVKIETLLGHGDLLSSQAGQRHQGALLSLARLLFPRKLVRFFFPTQGLFMLLQGKK
jgi:ubiquinone/menaquinone biosynthesis C-methylase UbiE